MVAQASYIAFDDLIQSISIFLRKAQLGDGLPEASAIPDNSAD
jgi:hypothetical protein